MTSTTTPTWEAAFNLFFGLEQETRLALRRAASAALVAEVAEEVGSSDVNHYLYRKFCEEGSWKNVSEQLRWEGFQKILGEIPRAIGTKYTPLSDQS